MAKAIIGFGVTAGIWAALTMGANAMLALNGYGGLTPIGAGALAVLAGGLTAASGFAVLAFQDWRADKSESA